MRQDVWSEKKWEADPKDVQARKEFAEQSRPRVHTREEAKTLNESFAKPVVYTREQARELEAKLLDKSEESGIIESISKQQDFMDRNPREQLSRYVIDPKTGERVLEEWSFRSNPLGEYPNIFSQTYSEDARAMAEYLNEKVNNGDYGKVDRIVIAKSENLQGISSYRHTDNTLFISEELITKEGFDRLVDKSYFPARNLDDVIIHELDGHKRHWDMVKKFYNENIDRYSSLEDAKQDLERPLREYIFKQQSSDYYYVKKNISENAFRSVEKSGQINEVIADCELLYQKGEISDTEFKKLFEELMGYDGKSK
ncbi:MAG: hypothetical protein IKP47_03840 [Ruminococcus sp.]|nr:hypothetical protein [Ruminococcus sp.]